MTHTHSLLYTPSFSLHFLLFPCSAPDTYDTTGYILYNNTCGSGHEPIDGGNIMRGQPTEKQSWTPACHFLHVLLAAR